MTEISNNNCDPDEVDHRGAGTTASSVNAWFVQEVLPLETSLLKFLQRGWRNESDIRDLCQDVYIEIYKSARTEIPKSAKALTFSVARNVLIDRIRQAQIVPIDAMSDPEEFGIALDEPGPDRTAMGRQELRRLQLALDRLPPRLREALVMRKVEGLTRPEIAARMGIAERTVSQHLASGVVALAALFHSELADPGSKP
jgi:RNA polymerase sigma factor (sigma-70 family)